MDKYYDKMNWLSNHIMSLKTSMATDFWHELYFNFSSKNAVDGMHSNREGSVVRYRPTSFFLNKNEFIFQISNAYFFIKKL